jgi:O-succinylbenzoate synthase
MPGDLSASKRYWQQDIIDPWVEIDDEGLVTVPNTVGLGHSVDEERIREHLVRYDKFLR